MSVYAVSSGKESRIQERIPLATKNWVTRTWHVLPAKFGDVVSNGLCYLALADIRTPNVAANRPTHASKYVDRKESKILYQHRDPDHCQNLIDCCLFYVPPLQKVTQNL